MALQEQLITRAAFHSFIEQPAQRERRYELINGVIVEMSPSQEHGMIVVELILVLGPFIKANHLGHLMTETAYAVPDDDYNERIPDVSFIRGAQTPVQPDGAVPGMPALAIEVKSPRNTLKGLREKAAYYLENGSELVWIVIPGVQQVEVHAANTAPVTLSATDTLDGGAVLPGFSVSVAQIFPQRTQP